ncbi:MAG: hypothetical protein JWL90_4060 [Chthoniobacteraceae bacterium]|nr:hypothetical protein [Chthoniobacteraceae bacterium]
MRVLQRNARCGKSARRHLQGGCRATGSSTLMPRSIASLPIMAWSVQRHSLDSRTVRVTLSGGSPLRVSDVLQLWGSDETFRSFFSECVIDSGFDAFFWETPPITLSSLEMPFEFVVVEGSSLGRLRPDPQPFSEHFSTGSGPSVLSFPNLRGDATLIVPAPIASDQTCYIDLSRFLRTAPPQQVDLFWQAVAAAVQQRVSTSPIWLSSAGMGVAWLHLRLDSHPKYYRHRPYTRTS